MAPSTFRLDWKRPPAERRCDEHAYRATDGAPHVLVIFTDRKTELAKHLARSMRQRNPDILMQDATEEAIATALHRRPMQAGQLCLQDSDLS